DVERRDSPPGPVAQGRGHRADRGREFLVGQRPAGGPHVAQRRLQFLRVGVRARLHAGAAGHGQHLRQLGWGQCGQQDLAQRGDGRREPGADVHPQRNDLGHRDAGDVDDVGTVQLGDRRGFAGTRDQPLHVRPGDLPQPHGAHVRHSELHDPRGERESVVVGPGVAELLKGEEDAPCGGPGQARFGGHLGQRHHWTVGTESPDHVEAPGERFDEVRVAASTGHGDHYSLGASGTAVQPTLGDGSRVVRTSDTLTTAPHPPRSVRPIDRCHSSEHPGATPCATVKRTSVRKTSSEPEPPCAPCVRTPRRMEQHMSSTAHQPPDQSTARSDQLTKTSIAIGFAVLCATYMLNAMDRQLFYPLLPDISAELGFSLEESGWLATGFTLGLALAGPPTGYLADRLSRKAIIMGSVLVYSLCTLMLPLSVGIADMSVYRLLSGVGEGVHATALYAVVGAFFFHR